MFFERDCQRRGILEDGPAMDRCVDELSSAFDQFQADIEVCRTYSEAQLLEYAPDYRKVGKVAYANDPDEALAWAIVNGPAQQVHEGAYGQCMKRKGWKDYQWFWGNREINRGQTPQRKVPSVMPPAGPPRGAVPMRVPQGNPAPQAPVSVVRTAPIPPANQPAPPVVRDQNGGLKLLPPKDLDYKGGQQITPPASPSGPGRSAIPPPPPGGIALPQDEKLRQLLMAE